MSLTSAVARLLALAVALAAFAPAPLVRAGIGDDDESLSPLEKQEARALAVRFVERLQKDGDAGPLVAELFLPDFAERFQKFVLDKGVGDEHPVYVGISRPVLAQAAPADLRRAFVALVNFWRHFNEFGDAVSDVTEARHNLVSVLAEDSNWKLRAGVQRAALPPAFFDLCKSDPLLALLSDFFEGAGREAYEVDGDEADDSVMLKKVGAVSVRSVERLRSLTEKIEKCAALMGEAAKTLREEMKAYPERVWVRTIQLSDVYRVEADTYPTEFFGFPPRTPFISARLFPYVVVMVRVEDRLQILGVLPDTDGD